jgi:Mrp family chromosome partitioning ATPase
MKRQIACAALFLSTAGMFAQAPAASPNPEPRPASAVRPRFDAFEVATVKPVNFDPKGGRYITMQGTNRFVEKAYTLKLLIAAACDQNPRTILGDRDGSSPIISTLLQ